MGNLFFLRISILELYFIHIKGPKTAKKKNRVIYTLNVTSPARAARSFKFYHSFTPFSVAACGPGPRISKAASKFLVMLASSLGRRLMFASTLHAGFPNWL